MSDRDLIAESHQAEVMVLAMSQGKDPALGVSVVKTIQRLADALEARQVGEAALTNLLANQLDSFGFETQIMDLTRRDTALIARAVVEFLGERHEPEPYEKCSKCEEAPVLGSAEDAVICMDCAYEMGISEGRLPVAPQPSESDRSAVPDAEAERDAALAAIERVREIHVRTAFDDAPEEYHCKRCQITAGTWPCPTVAALDGAPEPETAPENYEPKCNCEHVKRHTSPPLPVEGESNP